MDSVDLFILDDLNRNEISKSVIIITDSMYNNIIESIGFNYLLIIFTIGCFTSILCSIKNGNRYKLIENSNPVKAEVIGVSN